MNRIPAGAAALINRARAAGADITENLIDSPAGLIGHVKLKAPNATSAGMARKATRAFIIIFISEPRLQVGARRVTYHTNAGHVTRPTAERALIEFEREQLAAVHAQLDEVLGRTEPTELLTCEGCGATYADSMDHSQGEHDRRMAERAAMPATLADVARDADEQADAAFRRTQALNHRIVGALLKLALLPDEVPAVLDAAWQRLDLSEPVTQEALLTAYAAELAARVERLDDDVYASEPASETPERTCRCGAPVHGSSEYASGGMVCAQWPLCERPRSAIGEPCGDPQCDCHIR